MEREHESILLSTVAHSSEASPSKSASYETATLSEIILTPPERLIPEISVDYDRMKNMIYGEKPDFEIILRDMASLEAEIHALADIRVSESLKSTS